MLASSATDLVQPSQFVIWISKSLRSFALRAPRTYEASHWRNSSTSSFIGLLLSLEGLGVKLGARNEAGI